MRLTQTQLRQLIRDEIERALSAIELEEKKAKKEPRYKGCHGNPHHRSDTGRFPSEEELDAGKKGSASFWYACQNKLGRVATRGRKHQYISKPSECGRSSTTNPRRKCSDG